jgi:hypothetical protein
MKIHPLWFLCIFVRLSLILIINFAFKKSFFIHYFVLLLAIMGIGFIYKAITGSNNETQIAKVFWHNTRIIHGIFYLSASYYLSVKKLKLCTLILLSDLFFSISYRILFNK